jgi:hypothetical protein
MTFQRTVGHGDHSVPPDLVLAAVFASTALAVGAAGDVQDVPLLRQAAAVVLEALSRLLVAGGPTYPTRMPKFCWLAAGIASLHARFWGSGFHFDKRGATEVNEAEESVPCSEMPCLLRFLEEGAATIAALPERR